MTPGLPIEFMRGPQWSSPAARAEWEPVIAAAAATWSELEVLSIGAVRPSALLFVTYEELVRATRDCAAQGLEVTPVAEGRAAAHVRGLRDAWLAAWGDDDRVGQLLGFPACCRFHFSQTWAKGRTETFLDTAGDGPWELNLGLRWLGVRTVPHLPCSRACSASLDLARRTLALAPEAEREALRKLLELPLRYSAENGVGIVDAGAFRFMVGTDAPVAVGPEAWVEACNDNGFSSREAMDTAHEVVLRAVCPGHGCWSPGPGVHGDGHPWNGECRHATSALDLGAGDGTLLAKLAGGRPGSWVGVEADAGRAVRGMCRHPGVTIFPERIEDFVVVDLSFDVALLMPGRLLEMGGKADHVRGLLRTRARRVVAYAYADWLEREGGFEQLCADAGLTIAGPIQRGYGVTAAEVTP